MKEIFKPIKGYEGFYEISNYGNVKSLLNRYTKTKQVFIMQQDENPKGYKRVELSKPTKGKKLVHRLVAETFIPNNSVDKNVVNHKDNNPRNNYVENLEWVTQSENLQHAQKQKRLTEAQSKGGKATSELLAAKATANAKALVGTTTKNWKVVSYYGLKPVGKVLRESVVCECTGCGKQSIYEYIRLVNGTIGNGCRKCFSPLKKKVEDIV